jgi:hypothetical protein
MNHYCFHCPIKQDDVKLSDCSEVHKLVMQGKPHEVENKLCAVAHQAFMCPVRYAFRVGGPWHKPDNRPNWSDPKDKADKLPKDIVSGAIFHTLPSDQMYRRAGLYGDDVGMFTEFLRSLQEGGKIAPPEDVVRKTSKPQPKSKTSVIDEIERPDYADAINKAIAKSKASEKPAEKPAEKPEAKAAPPTTKSKKTRTTPKTTGSDSAPKPKLSLAERAKLMKEKRKTA